VSLSLNFIVVGLYVVARVMFWGCQCGSQGVVDEEVVRHLADMGFPEAASRAVLRDLGNCANKVQKAMDILLQGACAVHSRTLQRDALAPRKAAWAMLYPRFLAAGVCDLDSS
jgi:hypothetical protein